MATEKRLIDANAFESEISKMFRPYGDGTYPGDYETMIHDETLVDVLETINEAPTVDAVVVVHGRWLYDSGSGRYFCSACDEYALSFNKDTLYGGDLYEVCLTDYCPNCGAKMDGDGNV